MLTDFAESDADYRAWLAALTHTHQRRITARVMDLNHKRLSWIDNILDGQVTIDVTQREVSRVTNLRFLDPSRSLGWEPDSPASLPLHMKRMVQVFDERLVPGVGWVTCPVFCGPVSEMDRDGAEVSVVAEGKERLALGSFGRTHTWAKKRRKVEVIRDILELAGEASSRIHLPPINHTLPKELNVSRVDRPWIEARKLARSVGFELFYDGRGHVRMRRQSTKALLTLDEDWLLSPVRIDRPKLEFHNGWIVLGGKPKGSKTRVSSGLVALPAKNPFSAQSLSRGGRPRWLIHQEERSQVKTVAKCKEIANRLRDDTVRSAGELSLDCLPFPNVEEWDLLRAVDPLTGTFQVRVKQATIPLVAGNQTIGAIRRVSRGPKKRGVKPGGTGGL